MATGSPRQETWPHDSAAADLGLPRRTVRSPSTRPTTPRSAGMYAAPTAASPLLPSGQDDLGQTLVPFDDVPPGRAIKPGQERVLAIQITREASSGRWPIRGSAISTSVNHADRDEWPPPATARSGSSGTPSGSPSLHALPHRSRQMGLSPRGGGPLRRRVDRRCSEDVTALAHRIHALDPESRRAALPVSAPPTCLGGHRRAACCAGPPHDRTGV